MQEFPHIKGLEHDVHVQATQPRGHLYIPDDVHYRHAKKQVNPRQRRRQAHTLLELPAGLLDMRDGERL